MYRPRSLIALSNWVADSTAAVAGYRHSPGSQEQKQDAYRGAKSFDVPLYKRVKGRILYAYHRLTSCTSCERPGEIALSAVLLLFTLLLWVLHARLAQKAAQPRYVIILDGGSTGTRVHVFEYRMHALSSYPALIIPEPKLKVEPGLSSYAGNVAAAGASLQPLLEFAQRHVPASQQASTPIYLMATAGMRLVPLVAAEKVLEQCRAQLMSSAFMFQPEWASIISGTSEGLYGWIAANYAAGSLQAAVRNLRSRKEPKDPPSAVFKALIEMGGASAQVTFVPDPIQHSNHKGRSEHTIHLHLPGVTHPVWSHSYLGYGFDVVEKKVDDLVLQQHLSLSSNASSLAGAQQQHAAASSSSPVVDPCLPAGFSLQDGRMGAGEWYRCQELVAKAIDTRRCQAVADATCPELPKRMPKLTGDLLAIENFAYTARALSLPERVSLGDFAAAARRFCSRPFPQTLQQHVDQPDQQRYLWRYCFGSAFAWTMLHDVLQLGEGQMLQFTNTLKSRETGQEVGLDWALGAAVLLLSKRQGSEGMAVEEQRQLNMMVLLAAVVATVTWMAVAGVAIARRWVSAKAERSVRAIPSRHQNTPNKMLMLDVVLNGAEGGGKPAYQAPPVSTRNFVD